MTSLKLNIDQKMLRLRKVTLVNLKNRERFRNLFFEWMCHKKNEREAKFPPPPVCKKELSSALIFLSFEK